MKKSKTVLFGLIFALTACGGGGSGGGSGLSGRKVSKEEFISLAEAADKSFTVNYATIEYTTWTYGQSEQSGTQHYYYSGGSWQLQGSSSINDYSNLLNYNNLAGILIQVKSTTVYDEMDTYVEPFGVHVASSAGGNTMNAMDYQYQENGLLSYYYQSSSTEQVGKVYWQKLTVTYSFVS